MKVKIYKDGGTCNPPPYLSRSGLTARLQAFLLAPSNFGFTAKIEDLVHSEEAEQNHQR